MQQRSVIHFLWTNAVHSEMRPIYANKCFTGPSIHVWCKKFAHGREKVAASIVFFVRDIQRRVVRWDKCLNEFGRMLKMKQ